MLSFSPSLIYGGGGRGVRAIHFYSGTMEELSIPMLLRIQYQISEKRPSQGKSGEFLAGVSFIAAKHV
jgi:hypothetical protein